MPAHPTPANAAPPRSLLRLAVPIAATQLGMMAMGVVDALFVGRLSAADLAGVALANVYFHGVTVVPFGTLLALDPLVAQAVGADDRQAVARHLRTGLRLAVLLALPVMLLLLVGGPALAALRQPADVVPRADAFLRHSLAGAVPYLAFGVLKQVLQAHGRTRPVVVAILAANAVNALLDWVLIFGHFGLPALRVVGSAWATVLSRWLMAALLLAGGWPLFGPLLRSARPAAGVAGAAGATAPMREVLRLGLPIGLQIALEFGAFGATAMLIGRFGTVPVAAHEIAITIASLTFMVPLGVGQAAAVLTGHAIGAGDAAALARAARTALLAAIGFMSGTALTFLLVPSVLARAFTDVAAVVEVAALLIPVAGVFQIFDGLQVVAAGVLRGMGDTRAPLVINLVGFWGVGLPASWALAFHSALGPAGLWWGLVAALGAVSLLLVWRVRRLLAHPPAGLAAATGGGAP